ncbi:MAG: ATP-binding protein, partial [Hymenobacter sp.]
NNPELLEKAYVETSDRIKFDERVKMAVGRRDQVINTRPMRPVGRSGIAASANKVLTTRVTSQPVALLTLGLVGAGKTTFLRYVQKVSGKKLFDQAAKSPEAHWLYIDFRDYSKSVNTRDYIYEALFKYIADNPTLGDYEHTIKKAYEDEITALTRGPLAVMKGNPDAINAKVTEILMREYEQKIPYCRRILAYASRKTPLFLVIDNVDQQEEVEVQERIFLEAIAIARDGAMNLVLAMRDATYVKNRSSAVFDAFTFDAIYIDAPHIQSVLSKRFAIAEHLLKGKKFDMETDGGARVTVTDASSVISMLSASVLGTEVGNLIEVSATGDVRLALSMTKQFLQFGYST